MLEGGHGGSAELLGRLPGGGRAGLDLGRADHPPPAPPFCLLLPSPPLLLLRPLTFTLTFPVIEDTVSAQSAVTLTRKG